MLTPIANDSSEPLFEQPVGSRGGSTAR